MKFKSIILVCVILYLLPACVKEFKPTTNNYDELLVVDGAITNEKGSYTITLSKASKIQQFSILKPYSNCIVVIIDNFGAKEELKEINAGIYKTDSIQGMQGFVGRAYKVKITTPEGELYESIEEEILKPIGIKAVYPVLEHKNDLKLFHGRDGYQFYIDTEIPKDDNNYYLWFLDKTFKFKTDFRITEYYNKDLKIKKFYAGDSLSVCYKNEFIPYFFILSTANKSQVQTTHIPLNYEDNCTKALTMRYSLNVKQYTLNESTYKYWESIKKISDEQGELYTQQPYKIKNNIINLTNSEKPALGYFMAAGIATKRIFAPPFSMNFYYPECDIPKLPPGLPTESNKWPIYLTAGIYLSQECLDCTTFGFLKKPDYWID